MGYGVSSASLLVAIGLAPAIASASVRTAEIMTTLVPGIAHHVGYLAVHDISFLTKRGQCGRMSRGLSRLFFVCLTCLRESGGNLWRLPKLLT